MAFLAVQQQGARVTLRESAIVVTKGSALIRERPLQEITELQLYGDVELSAPARAALLENGVDVLFLSKKGQYRGRLVAAESKIGERRAAQYRWLISPGLALSLARRFVEGKLRNQRSFLLRVRRERSDAASPQALAALRQLIARVGSASSLETLRGIEGHGAAMYYRGFAAALGNNAFSFQTRNRRPPRDPVNACLSFGYTLLLARVESAVRKVGLDPYLGALHEAGRGKPALPLDLMEELRTPVVDRLVLRLINRHQLSPTDFVDPRATVEHATAPRDRSLRVGEQDELPVVYLGSVGRAIFLRELARVWHVRHFYSPKNSQHTLGDIVENQARQLARLFEEGDESEGAYTPFVLR